MAAQSAPSISIAQNWLDLRAERGPSTFDQRHLLTTTFQYSTGMGLGGGTLLSGWRGRVYKEWTVGGTIVAGSGLPETPVYLEAANGSAVTGNLRPDRTSASLYSGGAGHFLNAAAYTAPQPGQWGNAGRDSITGPSSLTFNASLSRTFPIVKSYNLDIRADATNLLKHAVFTSDNTTIAPSLISPVFGLPTSTNSMRSLQMTARVRSYMMRSWLTYLALIWMIAPSLRAQTIGQNKSPGASEVFTLAIRSQLMVEAVTVKDKDGKSVPSLTASDFTLTENGVEQKIRFCEHQTLPATALPLPATPAKDENVTIYKRLGRTQLAPEQPESLRYKDRRLLALYFDMSAMPPGDQLRALAAAEKFIVLSATLEVSVVRVSKTDAPNSNLNLGKDRLDAKNLALQSPYDYPNGFGHIIP